MTKRTLSHKLTRKIATGMLVPVAAILTGLATSCEKSEDDPAAAMLLLAGINATSFSKENMSSALTNYADNVVVPIYTNLADDAVALDSAADALKTTENDTNLQTARDAWKAARVDWEHSEAFLFGPVDTEGYDPRIDSWPLDKTDLDQAISDGNTNVSSLGDNIRGFHTVEYLLFDDGSGAGNARLSNTQTWLEANHLDYLAALTEDIKTVTTALENEWSSSGGDYAGKIKTAGNGSSIYPSHKAGIQEMINGMLIIINEVRTGKLADPYKNEDVTLVESRYAWNSLTDFTDNLEGVKHVWTGDYNGKEGYGLDELIATANPGLSEKITTRIEESITSMGEIQEPYREAITDDRASIQDTLDKLETLETTIESELLPLFQ